jgi:hypothetical protein
MERPGEKDQWGGYMAKLTGTYRVSQHGGVGLRRWRSAAVQGPIDSDVPMHLGEDV